VKSSYIFSPAPILAAVILAKAFVDSSINLAASSSVFFSSVLSPLFAPVAFFSSVERHLA
jgi:hypothetical protein